MSSVRPKPPSRAEFVRFVPITTRWADNDAYGHINNVVYYSYFDSAVNSYLIAQGALDIEHGEQIGLVVSSSCNFFSPLAFPQPLEAGLRVGHVGRSSVRYELGIFAAGQEQAAAAGEFVHVYVNRHTRSPEPLAHALLKALKALVSKPLA